MASALVKTKPQLIARSVDNENKDHTSNGFLSKNNRHLVAFTMR